MRYNSHLGDFELFFKENKRLIHKYANKWRIKGLNIGLEYDEIFNIAFMGFVKAYEKFDPIKFPDIRFSTYAYPMMKGELQRQFRDCSYGSAFKVPRSIVETINAISMNNVFDKNAEEIAATIDRPIELVKETLDFLNTGVSYLHNVVFENDGDQVTLEEQIGTYDDLSFINSGLKSFIENLSERDKKVLLLRMRNYTQSDIGEKIGVGQVQVSRRIRELGKLYKQVSGEGDIVVAQGNLEEAKRLLAETEMSMIQIANQTGCAYPTVQFYSKKIRYQKNPKAKNPKQNRKEEQKPSPVSEYKLSDEELQKYRELPVRDKKNNLVRTIAQDLQNQVKIDMNLINDIQQESKALELSDRIGIEITQPQVVQVPISENTETPFTESKMTINLSGQVVKLDNFEKDITNLIGIFRRLGVKNVIFDLNIKGV